MARVLSFTLPLKTLSETLLQGLAVVQIRQTTLDLVQVHYQREAGNYMG